MNDSHKTLHDPIRLAAINAMVYANKDAWIVPEHWFAVVCSEQAHNRNRDLSIACSRCGLRRSKVRMLDVIDEQVGRPFVRALPDRIRRRLIGRPVGMFAVLIVADNDMFVTWIRLTDGHVISVV